MRITIEPRREEALAAGYAALSGRIALGFGDFCAQLAAWDVRAFCDGERVVGMLMLRGPELHVAVLPEVRGRWLSRRLLREIFAPILERYGVARTSVSPDNAVGRDFVQRIRAGFAALEFDPTSVLISAGGSVLGGLLQGSAAKSAGQTQANAAQNATNATLSMFNTQNQQQAPYRTAGYSALHALGIGLGTEARANPTAPMMSEAAFRKSLEDDYRAKSGGLDPAQPTIQASINDAWNKYASGQTNAQGQTVAANNDAGLGALGSGEFLRMPTLSDFTTNLDPAYEFIKSQGIGAATNAGNVLGGAGGGNTLKGIVDYATNFAKTGAQTAYDIFQRSRDAVFNRLSDVAGFGQTANAQGVQAFGATAPVVSQATQAMGAAQAAGTVGQANALAGGANNALGWYNLGKFLNPGSGSFQGVGAAPY